MSSRLPAGRSWAIAGMIVLGLGAMMVAALGWDRSGPRELATRARQALKLQRWSHAEGLLDQLARQRRPTSEDAALRAELALGRGRSDEAVALLTGIPAGDRRAARARLIAGQIEQRRDRARSAEALLLEAARLDAKLVPARRELIILYALQARRAEISTQFGELADLEALSFDDILLWTASLEDIWINDTIQRQLERFLAADPEDRPSRLALVRVLLGSDQCEQAEALLRPLPDSDFDAQVLRARVALQRMRLDEVRSLSNRGPAEHLGLALLRGQLAVRMNDPSAASRQFRIALKMDPTNREALQGLSIVLLKLGRTEEAAAYRKRAEQWRELRALLKEAKDSTPGHRDPELIRHLGEVCENLGQFAEARAWYQLALSLNPLDPRVQRALYHLPHPALSRGPARGGSSRPKLKAETTVSSP